MNKQRKKVLINILIGKEKEDLLKTMDKKELKKLKKRFKRIKPTLDLLGKKETTNKDIEDFIKLIEYNQTIEILEDYKDIEKEMMFELKNGSWNDDIKNNAKDAEYWKGYRYGIQAFWSDFLIPRKEKWEAR